MDNGSRSCSSGAQQVFGSSKATCAHQEAVWPWRRRSVRAAVIHHLAPSTAPLGSTARPSSSTSRSTTTQAIDSTPLGGKACDGLVAGSLAVDGTTTTSVPPSRLRRSTCATVTGPRNTSLRSWHRPQHSKASTSPHRQTMQRLRPPGSGGQNGQVVAMMLERAADGRPSRCTVTADKPAPSRGSATWSTDWNAWGAWTRPSTGPAARRLSLQFRFIGRDQHRRFGRTDQRPDRRPGQRGQPGHPGDPRRRRPEVDTVKQRLGWEATPLEEGYSAWRALPDDGDRSPEGPTGGARHQPIKAVLA